MAVQKYIIVAGRIRERYAFTSIAIQKSGDSFPFFFASPNEIGNASLGYKLGRCCALLAYNGDTYIIEFPTNVSGIDKTHIKEFTLRSFTEREKQIFNEGFEKGVSAFKKILEPTQKQNVG